MHDDANWNANEELTHFWLEKLTWYVQVKGRSLIISLIKIAVTTTNAKNHKTKKDNLNNFTHFKVLKTWVFFKRVKQHKSIKIIKKTIKVRIAIKIPKQIPKYTIILKAAWVSHKLEIKSHKSWRFLKELHHVCACKQFIIRFCFLFFFQTEECLK